MRGKALPPARGQGNAAGAPDTTVERGEIRTASGGGPEAPDSNRSTLNLMDFKPFTELIKALAPDLWAGFERAVMRERREAEMRREHELYGRSVRFYSIEEAEERR